VEEKFVALWYYNAMLLERLQTFATQKYRSSGLYLEIVRTKEGL